MKKIQIVFMFLCSITVINAQTAEEIIKKHIEKIGGKKAWSNINSIQLEGELTSSAGSDEILSINKKGKYNGNKKVNGKMVIQYTFDGNDFWDFDRINGKPIKRSKEMSLRAKKEANEFPSMLVMAKDLEYKIVLLGEENIMGNNCYKLKIAKGEIFIGGKKENHESISFINKETLLEILTEEKHVRGDNMIYTYYKDYKEVNGVLLPFKINWFIDDNQMSIMVNSYIINAKIDDEIFKVN